MTVRISADVLVENCADSVLAQHGNRAPMAAAASAALLRTRMGCAFLSHKDLPAFNSHVRLLAFLSSCEGVVAGDVISCEISEKLDTAFTTAPTT